VGGDERARLALDAAGSRMTRRTAAAKASAPSAISRWRPDSVGSPSAPMVVDTTALPAAIASKILSRVPPPTRSGTIVAVAGPRCWRTSSTVPVTSTPASCASRLTAAVGARPTIDSVTSGSAWRTRGSTSRQKKSIASSFGIQSMDPTKARCLGRTNDSGVGVKKLVSTPVATTSIGGRPAP
jgi:hypothetical protein